MMACGGSVWSGNRQAGSASFRADAVRRAAYLFRTPRGCWPARQSGSKPGKQPGRGQLATGCRLQQTAISILGNSVLAHLDWMACLSAWSPDYLP